MKTAFAGVAATLFALSGAHAQQSPGFTTCSQAAEVARQHSSSNPHSARCHEKRRKEPRPLPP